MRMNLRPVFRYQFADYCKGSGIFFLVIIAIAAMSVTYALGFGNRITFSGYGIAAAISMFVFGIVTPRPHLRLCAQMGISRRTAFTAMLLAILANILLLALAGELLLGIEQRIGAEYADQFVFADLYQLLYPGPASMPLRIGAHLVSALLNAGLILCLFLAGMFLTFLFWRLNKVWTIIVAISIPILFNLISIGAYRIGALFPAAGRFFRALYQFLGRSAGNLICFLLVLSVVLAAAGWLLVRRANIKEPTSR